MKRMIAMLLCAALCVGSMAACSEQQPKEETKQETTQETQEQANAEKTPKEAETAKNNHYPLTISTFNYAKEPVEYTFEKAPERVLTFWSNSLETMLALGLGDKIVCAVGMDEESVLPELKPELEKMKNTEY